MLYLHVGEAQEAEGEETPEGHVLRYGLDSQGIVGLTVLGAQRILDDEGELRVTLLETRSDDPLIALDEMPAGSPLISLAEIKREFGIE